MAPAQGSVAARVANAGIAGRAVNVAEKLITTVLVASTLKVLDPLRAIIDTACRFSVAGRTWYEHYKEKITELGLADEILEEPENESYRFGKGGSLRLGTPSRSVSAWSRA